MTLGFSGAALMATLSSCVYKQADQPSPIILLPNTPSVSASTVVNSPISITTESAGTVIVYNNGIVVESITVKAGVNTYIPISTGDFTFVLQTNDGKSTVSAVVSVSAKTNTTPVAPTVSAVSVNTNNPITININQAGTIIVFNGVTQITSFAAVIGSNTYTPISDGTYSFKLQTTGGTSAASTAVNVSAVSATKDLLTLDLSLSANANLKKIGGYIRQNNIVVALIAADSYAAVTQICSHEGRKEIILQNGEFYCTAHGARYTTKGVGLNGDGRGGLTVYKTNLTSNILHVYV